VVLASRAQAATTSARSAALGAAIRNGRTKGSML
jgi:hypothetical protein